jgi:hypothetical protein
MAKCHQCKAKNPKKSRTGDCKICFAKKVTFCATCAMWELGPLSTTDEPIDELTKEPKKKKKVNALRLGSDRSDTVVSVDEPAFDCKVFLKAMGQACAYIEDQRTNKKATLYGKPFATYVCNALTTFHKLYAKCKYDRDALSVMILMHLSSQERIQCRDKADASAASTSNDSKYLKRWQTRTLAAKHLAHHLDDIGKQLGSGVKKQLAKQTWSDALGLDDIELFYKGFKTPTLMALELLDLAGSADAARETFEIATILYHSVLAARDASTLAKHWSAKTSSFHPHEALGNISKDHRAFFLDDKDPPAIQDDAQELFNTVWIALDDKKRPANALPSHPRFQDNNVPGSLTTVEKNYLQYLPTFDTPVAQKKLRSECEKVVRARVVDSLKKYREAYLKAQHVRTAKLSFVDNPRKGSVGKKKTIRLDAPGATQTDVIFKKLSGESHVSTTIAPSELQKINDFVDDLVVRSNLRAQGGKIDVSIRYETGNPRRDTRRDAVKQAVKNRFDAATTTFTERDSVHGLVNDNGSIKAWDAEDFLDKVLVAMQDKFHRDQAFDGVVAKLILEGTGFTPKAWFPLKLTDVKYSKIFPNCGFGSKPVLATIDAHYESSGGSSPRPEHYMDWRNHKDLWLYDCFHIDPRRRPLFASLSLQPIMPEPNPLYGKHYVLFKPSTTKHRAVYTFGDKQQPRRSMLLLLDDIFYERPMKDGADGQSATTRRNMVDRLLDQIDQVAVHGAKSLKKQWKATIEGDYVRNPSDGNELFECQIFGPVALATDGLALVTVVGQVPGEYWTDSKDVATRQNHLDTYYGRIKLLEYDLIKCNINYNTKRKQRPPLADQGDARADLLDKAAKDHATVP